MLGTQRGWKRIALAAMLCGAGLVATAAPALADGTLTVEITGAGTVKGEGINCARPFDAQANDCSEFFKDDEECEGGRCHRFPQIASVEATDTANGFSFSGWTGCLKNDTRTCAQKMDVNRPVTAEFRDVQDPTVSLTKPGAGPVKGTIALQATARDNAGVARVEFRVRNALVATVTAAPFAFNFNTATLADGAATVTATAVDLSGRSATTSPVNIAIDNVTPPQTTITSGIADGATTFDTSHTWSFVSSEAGSFACRVYPTAVTPGPFGPCSGTADHTATGFTPGNYTFEVRAIDAVGNIDPTPAKRTFTVAALPGGGAGGGTTGGGGGTTGGEGPTTGGGGPTTGGAGGTNGGGLATQRPFVVVTLAFDFRATSKQTRFNSLTVRNVPTGSTVTVTCKKGCAKKSFVKRNASGTVSLTSLVRKPLNVGSVITVTVSRDGAVPAVKVLKVRARRSPLVTTR